MCMPERPLPALATGASPMFRITVVHAATPNGAAEHSVELPKGATVAEAVVACGFTDAAAAGSADVGVWGRRVPPTAVLADGDRVELYRPLTVDPMTARRTRFTRQGARAAGLFARTKPL